jgi:DNA (cytosine-5)-methyltransferase 1
MAKGIKFATVASGIGAPEVAAKQFGWKQSWCAQYDPEHDYRRGLDFPSKVLKYHYPSVPNLGDMTKLYEKEEYVVSSPDVIIGGTPCQSFSIAGRGEGMGDERGRLTLEFIRILAEKRPRFFVWENVQGVLTNQGGASFAEILGGFTGRAIEPPVQGFGRSGIIEGVGGAYSVCWRVFNGKYFGVPQDRRRVFVVGHLHGWAGAAAALLEQESLPRVFTKNGKEGQEGATRFRDVIRAFKHVNDRIGLVETDSLKTITTQADSPDEISTPAMIQWPRDIIHTIPADFSRTFGMDNQSVDKGAFTAPDFVLDMEWNAHDDHIGTITKGSPSGGGQPLPAVISAQDRNLGIRRLSPLEIERAMGFPDYYTHIFGDRTPYSPMYRALGNSIIPACLAFIFKRIDWIINDNPL